MKNNKIIRLLGTGIFVLSAMASCDDMSDIYKGYIEDGERIYIGIADSLSVTPGNCRALVEWKIDNDPKLKESIIKWSDNDSVIVPIEQTGVQWMETVVSNLPEGSLIFTAYTRDIYGNVSLKTEKTQEIYGATYISNLSNRKIAKIKAPEDGKIIMDWNSMDDCVGVNLYYTDKEGNEIKHFVPDDEMQTVLEDVKMGSEFYYTTLYKPTEECLDEFESTPYYMTFPAGYQLDRTGWSAEASSDAESKNDGGPAGDLIDGDFETYWHSLWGDDAAQLPHWIMLDMKEVKTITDVSVYRRLNNNYCKTIEIYYSDKLENDDNSFVLAGTLEYSNAAEENGLTLTLNEAAQARYIKCVITDSYTPPFACLSEIEVSGIED